MNFFTDRFTRVLRTFFRRNLPRAFAWQQDNGEFLARDEWGITILVILRSVMVIYYASLSLGL